MLPAQVLAKSSKMIPVMLMGTVLHGKRYSALEYACCLAISGAWCPPPCCWLLLHSCCRLLRLPVVLACWGRGGTGWLCLAGCTGCVRFYAPCCRPGAFTC